jgi:hypothetical protein
MIDMGGGKTRVEMSVTQSQVSGSFRMEVPVDIIVKGEPHRLGLVALNGPRTVTGSVVLPVRPDKVVLDSQKSILCTIQQ